MSRREQHERVAGVYLAGELRDDPVEVLSRRLLVQDSGHPHLAVSTSGSTLHVGAERRGVFDGEIEPGKFHQGGPAGRGPTLVDVLIDADREHMQFRLGRVGRAGECHRAACRQRGEQVATVIGYGLDGVLSRVERQRAGDGVVEPVTAAPDGLSTPAVTPLTRHSMRPIPPPWSVTRVSIVKRSAACASVGNAPNDTSGAAPLSRTLSRLSASAALCASPTGSPARVSLTRSGLNKD